MPKPPQASPERVALAAAHQQLLEAQAALAAAEDAHRQALLAWSEAGSDAEEIETRITRLRARKTFGITDLRIEQANQLDTAYAELKREEAKVHPFLLAKEETQARIPEAQRAVSSAQDQITAAARRVACAEAPAPARAYLARLQEAYAILLEAGPDLLAAIDRGLVPPDLAREAEQTAGALMRRATYDWPAYEARYRQSAWYRAVEILKADPQAPLPQAAAP